MDKALRELGFPEYVSEVLAVAGEHKEQLRVRGFCLFWGLSERLLTKCADEGEEDEQDGTERVVGGGIAEAATGAVQVGD